MRLSGRVAVVALAAAACPKGGDSSAGDATASTTSGSGEADDGGSAPPADLGAPGSSGVSTSGGASGSTETSSGGEGTVGGSEGTGPAAVCGDGVVEGDEKCDLGPDNADDGPCTSACELAICGDGLVQAMKEECDLGLMNADNGACTKACTKAKCGDGLVFDGVEECDKGANNKSGVYGGCTPMTCTWGPRCGDAEVQSPEEECDDGEENGDPASACTETCTWDGKLVFATSKAYSGALGGLDGADDKCNALAMEAGLANAGAFMAWMSDGGASPTSRMEPWSGRYLLVNGTMIAESWADLCDGSLAAPIAVDEKGGLVAADDVPAAWTGTGAKGLADAARCVEWKDGSKGAVGRRGSLLATDAGWTSHADAVCSLLSRLICVEQ